MRYTTVLTLLACQLAAEPIDDFLSRHGNYIYQDIVIKDDVYAVGSDQCASRYELIQPVLNQYQRPFSVLDLGAAQGYFSFRIAHDHPESTCVMIEANNTSYYARHGDMLFDLCHYNAHLPNIIYFQKRLNLADLKYLQDNEHFDVILAFLVVHLMEDDLRQQVEILNHLLKLGDNLVLEVANDVDVIHTSYVDYLSHALNARFLGEVKRHKDPLSQSTGRLYWFQSNPPETGTAQQVSRETYIRLNGVYPTDF